MIKYKIIQDKPEEATLRFSMRGTEPTISIMTHGTECDILGFRQSGDIYRYNLSLEDQERLEELGFETHDGRISDCC